MKILLLLALLVPFASMQSFKPKEWKPTVVSPQENETVPLATNHKIRIWGTFSWDETKKGLTLKDQRSISEKMKGPQETGFFDKLLNFILFKPKIDGTLTCNGITAIIHDIRDNESWEVYNMPVVPGPNTITCIYTDKKYTTQDIVNFTYNQNNQAPVARIVPSATSGLAPLTVTFNGSTSSDPNGAIVNYQWQFPNGTTASGQTASYTFLEEGVFDVDLIVTDNLGANNSTFVTINVSADTNSPTIAFLDADGTSFATTTPLVEIDFDDVEGNINPESFLLMLDGVNITPRVVFTNNKALMQFTTEFPLPRGEHAFTARISDNAGNQSSEEVTYLVDDGSTVRDAYLVGRVFDKENNPIKGVTVNVHIGPVTEDPLTAVSNAEGEYKLPFQSTGLFTLKLIKDGYVSVLKQVDAVEGADYSVPEAVMMVADSKVTVVGSSGGSAVNTAGTVSISIPSGALSTNTNITMTEANFGRGLEIPLPPLTEYTYAVSHGPAGTIFNQPITVSTNNDLGFPAGSQIALGVTDDELGVWTDAGSSAVVSSDGSKIVYQLSHFSSSDANNAGGGGAPPPAPQARNPQDGGAGGQCPAPAQLKSCIVNYGSGSLGIQLELPKIKRMEEELGLTLRYNSTSAYPTVMLEALNNQDHPNARLPLKMKAIFNFAGREYAPEYVPETNINQAFFRVRTVAQNINGDFLKSGSHFFEHSAIASSQGYYLDTPYFGGPGIPETGLVVMRSLIEAENGFTHRVIVQNDIDSPYGAGWRLEGLDNLDFDVQGTVVHSIGNGRGQIFFPIPDNTVSSLELNDNEYTDVLSYKGYIYASSCSENSVYRITLSGEVTKIAELNCPSRLSPSRKGGLYVVTNNGQDITFLPLSNKSARKIIAKTNNTDPITSVHEDSVLAVHFTQGSHVKTVSPKNGEILSMIGEGSILDADLVNPVDVTTDKYGSFIVLDAGQNKLFQIFPKSATVRELLSPALKTNDETEKEKTANSPELSRPNRLVYDSVLKRYFILEDSGRLLHWKGPGFTQLDQIGFSENGFEHVFGKSLPKDKRSKIKSLTFSPELGFVYIDDSGIVLKKLDMFEKNIAVRNYISPVAEFSKLSRLEDGSYELVTVEKKRKLFNAQGKLTSIITPDGKTTNYIYQNSLLVSIVTPSGDSYTLSYNGNAKLTAITDPSGRSTEFEIDSVNNLVNVTFSDSTTQGYSYNSAHLMTSETDKESKTTFYEYNDGRIKKETYHGGRVRSLIPLSEVGLANSFMKAGQLAPLVGPESMFATHISPEQREERVLIGATNSEIGRIDGNGNTSYIARSGQTLPIRSVSPEGRVIQKWYDAKGRIAFLRDANGKTFYEYDPQTQKPSKITRNEWYPELYTYYPSGLLHTKTDRKGNVTTLSYFSNGVISSVTNSANDSVTFEIDSKGNIISQKDSLNNKTEMVLNDAGYVVSSTDPKGQITTIARDDWNRVTSITTPQNGNTSFTYSPGGNLLSVTDARGQTTSYTYNEQDLIASESNEAGLTRNFTYDQDGLLTQETTWSGQAITYEYDGAKRLIRKVSPDDETLFERDGDGNAVSVLNSESLVENDFDKLGRLSASWQKGVTNTPVKYNYAEDGTVQGLSFGQNLEERYTVDANDQRITTNINHFGLIQTWKLSWDILSRPRVLTYPNGLTSTKNYGANSWISSITHSTGAFNLNFSYDENGNITGITENGLLGPRNNNYVYDSENRLTAVSGSTSEVFNMDLLGNILNGNAVFNNRNQLTENAEHFFEYDLNGNLSKKTAKLSPKIIEYDFDLENRLKQVRIFDNGTTLSTRLSYKYDAFGRRIERKVEGAQTKITQFVHDGQDVLLEQNQTGQLERTYIRGPGIDELYGVIEDLNQSGTLSSSEAFFFRTDHLGSVREVVKSDGLTRQSYLYSSYGVPTTTVAPGNSELKVNRLYTGREYEPETGDYYYRARYYDPGTGRFLSEDPIGFKGKDVNLYRYVRNNPLRYSDPSGLFSSSGESERARCKREALERYYREHQGGNLQCENTLESSMNYCDSIPEEPQTIEDLLGDPTNEL